VEIVYRHFFLGVEAAGYMYKNKRKLNYKKGGVMLVVA
jgi:hypothetical protein